MKTHFPWRLLLLGLTTGVFTATGSEPHGAVPKLELPVRLDGRIDSEEWSDAALFRRIWEQDNRVPGLPATEFRMKYDDEALYVAATGFENNPDYPEAAQRKWDDLLFCSEDAFSVILGLPDNNVAVQEKINMGGYEGALGGRAARADFYYTFTVNATGSRQRMFNEMPLENALFDSAIATEKGKFFTAEFRIPFRSFGLSMPEGKKIFMNFFRFRPPEVQAWNHKRFKGYAAMPFGTIRLLPEAENSGRTLEERPTPPAPARRNCRAELQYSPLSGAVIGKVYLTGQWDHLTGILNVSGFPEQRRELFDHTMINRDAMIVPGGERLAYLTQPLTPGSQKETRKARFRVVDRQGNIVSETSLTCPAVTAPEWFGKAVAAEYLREKIPAPWTKPTVSGREVRLVHAKHVFNDYLLPGDGEVELASAGKTVHFTPVSFSLEENGNDATGEAVLAAGPIRLELKSRMEPDGFTELKFRFRGVDPAKVDRIRLVIPRQRADARLILPGTLVQNAAAISPAGYSGKGEQFWIGNYEKGLAFSFDTDLFFGTKTRRQITVKPSGEKTEVAFTFVDGPSQFTADTVFRLFLQPTPTKPRPPRPIRELTVRQWEQWADWHGYPDTGKIPELRKWTGKLKRENRIGILYTCQGLREDAPFFREFRSDFELQPRWRYYRDRGKECYAANKRGPEGELQLYYWQQLIQQGGVRGIASDGTSPAWGDTNPALAGTDALDRRAKWEEMSSRIVAQRAFLKRLRGLFTDTGDPFAMMAHTGGGLDVNTLSFFDGYMEGEQMTRFRTGYFLPEAVYAVGYSGLPWGWRSIFWSKHWRNYLSQDSSLAYSLLFHTEFNGNFQAENPDYDLELTRDFEGPGTSFHPFWNPDPRLKFHSDRAKASLYLASGKALIAVSNLTPEQASYTLDFSALFPAGAFHAQELLDNRPLTGSRVTGTIEPHSCDVIRIDAGTSSVIEKKKSAVSPSFRLSGNRPDDWKANADGKTRFFSATPEKLTLRSAPGGSRAAAATLLHPFDRDFELDFTMKATDRFRFILGPVTIGYGNGWVGYGWFVKGPVAKRGKGHVYYQVPLRKGEEVPVRISLRNGVLNLLYNRIPVVRNLPLDLPDGNRFELQTWHDDTIEYSIDRMASEGEKIIENDVIHPVLN